MAKPFERRDPDQSENVDVPTPPVSEITAPSTTEYVRYVGKGGTERLITEAVFHSAGVHGQKTASWNNANGYRLPASFFTPDALALVLAQPGLILEESPNGVAL